MEDLIRRSDAIKAIEALECFGYIECKTKGLVKDINAIPSADRPNEVIYGNEHNCIMTIFGECSYAETGCGDCAVVEKVRKALSTDRPQGWIPCSERMPMYNVDVLVYRPTMGQKIIVDTYCGFYGEDIDDLDEWYEGWGISREHAVTAWMPLPKPWKGADDDN